MSMEELFLFELFEEIRSDKSWITPGLEEYFLLLEVIRSEEYDITSFNDLAFVLETIWLKSFEHADRFRKLLEERRAYIIKFAELLKSETTRQIFDPDHQKQVSAQDIASRTVSLAEDTVGPDKGQSNVLTTVPEEPADADEDYVDQLSRPVGFSLNTRQRARMRRLEMPSYTEEKVTIYESPYLFTNDYLPVKNRQLQHAWRSLQSRVENGDTNEISIHRIINATARQGYFSGLLFEKRSVNKLKLLIFIDRSDSMVAVEDFGKELCDSVLQSESHTEFEPWYFSKLPRYNKAKDDLMFTDEKQNINMPLRAICRNYLKKDIAILIYSDGGTLNNEYDKDRIDRTLDFVNAVQIHAGFSVWINPAPRSRWENTNSGVIASRITMFGTSRKNIEQAVNVLKGKVVPHSTKSDDTI